MLPLVLLLVEVFLPRLAGDAVEKVAEDGAEHGPVRHVHRIRILAEEEQLGRAEQVTQQRVQADAQDDKVGGEGAEALGQVGGFREDGLSEVGHLVRPGRPVCVLGWI